MYGKASAGIRAVSVGALLAWIPYAGQALAEDAKGEVEVAVGAGLIRLPKYPGSDQSHAFAFPVINVSYGRFFAGDQGAALTGLGVHLYRDYRWTLGAAIGPDPIKPRTESDDPRLKGLGDIPRTFRAGVRVSFTHEWLTLRASAASDVGNKQQGTLLRLEALARYTPTERLMLYAGPGATWASKQYVQTFFGIDGEQSARSGSPEYRPEGGLNTLQLTAGLDYRIDRHWGAGLKLALATLKGDAAASPITQDKSQNSVAVFAAYFF